MFHWFGHVCWLDSIQYSLEAAAHTVEGKIIITKEDQAKQIKHNKKDQRHNGASIVIHGGRVYDTPIEKSSSTDSTIPALKCSSFRY